MIKVFELNSFRAKHKILLKRKINKLDKLSYIQTTRHVARRGKNTKKHTRLHIKMYTFSSAPLRTVSEPFLPILPHLTGWHQIHFCRSVFHLVTLAPTEGTQRKSIYCALGATAQCFLLHFLFPTCCQKTGLFTENLSPLPPQMNNGCTICEF